MKEKIKLALRIKNSAFDDEITDLIDAAKADLKLSGVLQDKITDTDILIIRAVTLYAKAHFGLDSEDGDKYCKAYESLKNHLCLSAEYTKAVE
jgi:hypothetical protein